MQIHKDRHMSLFINILLEMRVIIYKDCLTVGKDFLSGEAVRGGEDAGKCYMTKRRHPFSTVLAYDRGEAEVFSSMGCPFISE